MAKAENWYELAETVIVKIDAAQHGDREGIYRHLAVEMGIGIDVLRRLARAYRFLADTEADDHLGDLPTLLRSQPLSCVNVIVRWSNYSPDHAAQHARRLVDGQLDLASLTKAEEDDRKTGERVAGATDRAWQTYAMAKAAELISSLHPDATLAWAARGWRPAGSPAGKPPGALGQFDHLPIAHLIFARNSAPESKALLVSVMSNQGYRPRMPTLIGQTVLTLSGYARLGFDALLLCGLTEDLDIANRVLDQMGRPPDVGARLIELG